MGDWVYAMEAIPQSVWIAVGFSFLSFIIVFLVMVITGDRKRW